MTLQGKGFFTFDLSACEGGAPASILAVAQTAGLSHVLIQIADGMRVSGLNAAGVDGALPVVQALRAAGIAVWGWHSIYGDNASAEAALAITRTKALGLDGYVVDAGNEFTSPGMAGVASQFMQAVRTVLPVPIALRSYGFPNYHPAFPWAAFLEACDLHMPRVHWEQAHNAGDQLRESKRQCDALPYARPYIPTGIACATPTWSPTVADINDFLQAAQALGLPAVNFFDWEDCRKSLPLVWKAIAGFAWPAPKQILPSAAIPAAAAPVAVQPAPVATPATPAVTQPAQPTIPASATPTTAQPAQPDAFLVAFLEALNSLQAGPVTALYDPAATQVWENQILRSAPAIQANYAAFFAGLPDGTVFTISTSQVEADERLLTWNASFLSGETVLVVQNGKIVLEYTFIT
ncbi:MAG: nuclear transport factor 2 family protein [Anaerolineales bacterium]